MSPADYDDAAFNVEELSSYLFEFLLRNLLQIVDVHLENKFCLMCVAGLADKLMGFQA